MPNSDEWSKLALSEQLLVPVKRVAIHLFHRDDISRVMQYLRGMGVYDMMGYNNSVLTALTEKEIPYVKTWGKTLVKDVVLHSYTPDINFVASMVNRSQAFTPTGNNKKLSETYKQQLLVDLLAFQTAIINDLSELDPHAVYVEEDRLSRQLDFLLRSS